MQTTLKLRQIVSGKNYREHYDPAEMLKLEAAVIAAGGLMQPIIVRPLGDGIYEIIAGERRYRVVTKLYGESYDVPVVIREATDAEARALGIIENNARDNPGEVEEARGAAELLSFNAGDKAQTAAQLGWDVQLLERRLLLLNCTATVQQALIGRRIKIGHAELLAGLAQDRQDKVLANVLESRATVQALKANLGVFAKRLADAIFDTAQCTGCQHNSARQSALFDESVGEGFCQNPPHYDELTLQAVEAGAAPLREQFPVVRLVKLGDGFTPLVVTPVGELGVGAEQYAACKGCASFGCSVSAVPGSYGQVRESLCFDGACHSTKVDARRKQEREAARPVLAAPVDVPQAPASEAAASSAVPATVPSPQPSRDAVVPARVKVPTKIIEYRTEQWRKWVARSLMAQPERNQRVLSALVLAGQTGAMKRDRYVEAAKKVAGFKGESLGITPLRKVLEQVDGFDAAALPTLVQAVAAAAAYGVDDAALESLLNYLAVDEAEFFTLDRAFMDLLTVSEMEAVAVEVGLKKAMGSAFQKARSGKRADFLAALLNVKGFTYRGTVPSTMRYARRKFNATKPARDVGDSTRAGAEAAPQQAVAPEAETITA